MTVGIVLPLILLALLVFVLVVLARRAAGALAVSRAASTFQGEVAGLAGRLLPVVDDLVRRVDAVRRHQLPAEEIRQALGEVGLTLEHEREVIAAWALPAGVTALVGDLSEDLDRLARAVGTIDHGAQLVAEGTGRQRELEAQTAIKRGYLNLLHGRQSFQDPRDRGRESGGAVAQASPVERLTGRYPRRVRARSYLDRGQTGHRTSTLNAMQDQETPGPTSAAALSLLGRLFLLSRVELVSFLVIIALMVFKPTLG